MTARLVTIPQSHYCEKARWALDRWAVPYVEDAHLPVFSRLATRRYGAGTVPILVLDDGKVLRHSAAILAHVHATTTRTPRPFPDDDSSRKEHDAWLRRIDDELGPAARVFAYHAIFADLQLVRELSNAQGPWLQRQIGRLAAGPVRRIISRSYHIDDAESVRALGAIERVFDDVAARLADGRRYLGGKTFGALDVTFASLAAAALFQPEYPFPFPSLDRIPAPARETIERLRETIAGRFVTRLYREDRKPGVTPPPEPRS